jgi:catechol 2,3-dioxygenase-like lactoylglutathione lyase family enzyme
MLRFDHIFVAPADWKAAVDFYTKTLGLSKSGEWGDPASGRGAQLESRGGFSIVLAEYHQADSDHSKSHGYSGSKPTIYLEVPDIDEWFAMLQSKDHVLVEPETTHWGIRWVLFKDPDGNIIAVYSAP